MLNIRKKKLKPYYVSQLTKFIDEHAGPYDDQWDRQKILKRVTENLEVHASGITFCTQCSDDVFFSKNPREESLSQCISLRVWINHCEYTFIATFDDFYEVESSRDKK